MVYPMVYGTEFISHRPHGCPVAADCALGTAAETWWTTRQLRTPRSHQRDSLHDSQWLRVAGIAARPSSLSHRVPLLPLVAEGWNLGTDPRQASRASSKRGGEIFQAVGCSARQPECQDDRTRRAARLRRGEKKSSGASGTLSLTRLACYGRWSSPRPTCRIATAENSPCRRFASRSNFPKSFGWTRHIGVWLTGPGSNGSGSLKSSLDLRVDLRFNPSAGSSNELSAGSTAPVDFPNHTNALSRVIMPSCKSLSFT